jgi:hypothetical protein
MYHFHLHLLQHYLLGIRKFVEPKIQNVKNTPIYLSPKNSLIQSQG